jgi:hypothetical protein
VGVPSVDAPAWITALIVASSIACDDRSGGHGKGAAPLTDAGEDEAAPRVTHARYTVFVAATLRDLQNMRWSALVIDAPLLHRFAQRHNWDEGYALLERCVRHPECSLATALLLYWLGRPNYFRQYSKRVQVPTFERKNFDFLALIERRTAAGEYEHVGIAFDPRKYKGTDLTGGVFGYDDLPKKRSLPADVCVALTKTRVVPFELSL